MAYVPPNKRSHVQDEEKQLLQVASVTHKFGQQLKLGSRPSSFRYQTEHRGYHPASRITADTICRLLPVGLTGDSTEIPSSVDLKRYHCGNYELKTGKKYFTLVNAVTEANARPLTKDPCLYIAEKIKDDVLAAIQHIGRVIENDGSGEIRSSVVARLGKILFYGDVPLNFDLIKDGLLCGSLMGGMKKLFFTTVPDAYIEYVENQIARDGKFGSMIAKERFMIKIVDKERPSFVALCKCTRSEEGKLKLVKVETNSSRHLIVDMALFSKPLDVRILLDTKQKLVSFTDEEKDFIYKIVRAAIIDPNVKDGLKWPHGKDSVAGRFHVLQFNHLKSKSYFSSIMRVKLRYADRFDLQTSVGEYGCEVTCKLTDLKRYLEEEDDLRSDAELVETLKKSLRFIWDTLLNWDGKVDLEQFTEQ